MKVIVVNSIEDLSTAFSQATAVSRYNGTFEEELASLLHPIELPETAKDLVEMIRAKSHSNKCLFCGRGYAEHSDPGENCPCIIGLTPGQQQRWAITTYTPKIVDTLTVDQAAAAIVGFKEKGE